MRLCLTKKRKNTKIIIYISIILIASILLFGCTKKTRTNSIYCNLEEYSLYGDLMKESFPLYRVEKTEKISYSILETGGIIEAFDTQAIGAKETKLAKYWYPQYLATVIIAIDRDQTNALVKTWNDLFTIEEEVGFFTAPGNIERTIAAISYGLEGEKYTLERSLKLLSSLHKKSLLKINSFEAPILICYDYQGANLIKAGRNIEIIVPEQGTKTYEKGLLSNEELIFQENIGDLLLQANFGLLDGKSDISKYPNEKAYELARKNIDHKHFAKTTKNIRPLFERKVLNKKRFMSIDYREHLYFALIYIGLVTIWTVSSLSISMQRGISYFIISTGILLNAWALVRLIKYQVSANQLFSRYLWYSYYIFFLLLPLVILWMAWVVDKPEKNIYVPKFYKVNMILASLLIILVFTNDMHGLVFKLDLTNPNWDIDYSYGLGYYTILFVCMLNIVIAFILLLKKSIRGTKKKRMLMPFLVLFLFGYYNYKYIRRDAFAYQTDITIVSGLFLMLMFEACIYSGLIPVNTKYIEIFKASPLRMQILNKGGKPEIKSALARPIDKEILEVAIALAPNPILQEDESLLYLKAIPGGYALWTEDISKIQELYREIERSRDKLMEANKMLAEKEKLSRSVNEKKAKKELMEQLEKEISEKAEKLFIMIEELEDSENHLIENTRVALLLCYIKRRCNLFFKEKEMEKTHGDKLIMYIEELAQIAEYSNLKLTIVNRINKEIPVRYMTLFYDYFYTIIDLGVQKACSYIIVDLGIEKKSITMKLLPSKEIGISKEDSKLIKAIIEAKGEISNKPIEDTVGISLSFPRGGG